MKKISTFFMSAICMVALMSVTSCKDYDDDRYFDQNTSIPIELNLTDLLEQQRKSLQAQIDAINAHIKDCKCDERYAELKNEIANLNTQLTNLTNQLNNKLEASDLEALNTLIANLQTQIDDLQAKLNNLQIPEACNCAGKWEQLAIDLDALKSDINNLKANQEANNTAIEQLNGSITQLSNSISTVQGDIISLTNAITQLQQEKASVEDLNKAVASIDSLKNDLEGTKADLLEEIGYLRELINSVIGRLDYFGGSDQTIEEVVGNLYENVNTLQTDYVALYDRLGKLEGKAAADSVWIAHMKELYGDSLQNLATKSDLEVLTTKEELDSAITEVKQSITNLEGKVDSLAAAQADFEEVVSNTIQQLQDWIMTEIEQPLKQEIYNINEKLTSVEERVTALETKVEEISGLLTKIQEALHRQITGVITQEVINPAFGSVSLPVGIKTNLLVAYYGTCETGGQKPFKFPLCKSSDSWTGDTEDRFTQEELAGVATETYGQGSEMLREGANAGRVYLTINPSTFDFEGAQFKLVNSRNEESGITLSAVRPSDKLLSFGISRSAENGFYEADATLAEGQGWKNSPNISKGNLKDLASKVKNLLQNKTGVKSLVNSLYTNLSDIIEMPAYALQASYTTDEGKTAYVHSNYDIAALAVKPLSYNLDLGSQTSKIPHKTFRQISYISDKLNKHLNSIHEKMTFKFRTFNMDETFVSNISITIGTITLDDVTVHLETNPTVNAQGSDITITKEVDYTYEIPLFEYDAIRGEYVVVKNSDGSIKMETKSGQTPVVITIPGNQIQVNGTANVNTDVSVPMTELANKINNDIIAKMNEQLGNIGANIDSSVNELIGNLTDEVNRVLQGAASDINGQIDSVVDELLSLSNSTNSYIDRVNSYISRVNNLLNRIYGVLDNANHYLQPVLLAGNNGVDLISSYVSTATRIKANDLVVYPTSYLAETVNPAYKKFVKVTKVWDANGNPVDISKAAALNAAKNMNVVIDGNVRAIKIPFNSQCVGYTYEIAYSAIDYCGYQTVQRYYVKVVK